MANLWGKEIVVNEQESVLEDFSLYLETSMLATIEIFKSIITIQKMGWLNDARDFLPNILPKICAEVEIFLVSNNLMNPPNWKIFLKDRLEIATEAGQLIHSYHEDCFKMCASQYHQQYQATYEQELAKQEGLGFGILSSSLAAHLVYAAQSARKEIENEKKASEAADRIMSTISPVDRAAQMTIAFYHKKFDPFVVDFLVSFYSDIEKLIYDGLDVDKERLENNKTLSENELLNITEANHREIITSSLSKHPFNGNALLWAIRYNDADDGLIKFCSESPRLIKKYLYAIEKSAIAFLKKQREKADLYNRDPLTDDVARLLQSLRAFLMDERVVGVSTYNNIVQEVYGDKIDSACKDFETLMRIKDSSTALIGYAKTNKTFTISANSFKTLKKYDTIFRVRKIRDILDNIPNEIDAFNQMILTLSEEIKTEYEKHQEAERNRKQEEFEKEERRKAEEQRQRELEKAKFKKTLTIVVSIIMFSVAVLIILNFVIIPNSKYNKAIALMDAAKYEDAIAAFEAMGNYKDSKEQIGACKTAIKEIDYQKANQEFLNRNYEKAYSLFGELLDYKDSSNMAKESALYAAGAALVNKNYYAAIDWYLKAGYPEEVKAVKYQYVMDHKNNINQTTFDYLIDLKAANYRDSSDLFAELYRWKLEIIAVNSDPESTENKSSISKYKPVYIHFKVTGGTPNGSIIPYIKYTLPSGKTGTHTFDRNYYDGSTGWYGWSEGIYATPTSGASGILKVEFYTNWYNGDLIGTANVKITS